MKKFIPILILISLLVPFVAYAGFGDIISGIFNGVLCLFFGVACPDPCLQLISETGTAAYRLCKLVDRIAGALYVIGWSLAMVILLWGGISYMVSGGNEDQVRRAKKIIINGLIGTAIVLCAAFILNLLLDFLYPLFS